MLFAGIFFGYSSISQPKVTCVCIYRIVLLKHSWTIYAFWCLLQILMMNFSTGTLAEAFFWNLQQSFCMRMHGSYHYPEDGSVMAWNLKEKVSSLFSSVSFSRSHLRYRFLLVLTFSQPSVLVMKFFSRAGTSQVFQKYIHLIYHKY